MLTGVAIDTIIESLGDTTQYPRDLKKELARHGWEMSKKSVCKLPDVPNTTALLFGQVTENGRQYGHWILWTDNEYHDPRLGTTLNALGPEWSGSFYACNKL